MRMLNLSAEHDHILYSWLPNHLNAETVVCFPDACPGRSPLPTGTATLLRRPDWRRFAISDCGCGMRLLRSEQRSSALTQRRWDLIADALRANKGGLGDLGGGNHFVDAIQPYDEDRLYFLVLPAAYRNLNDCLALLDGYVEEVSRYAVIAYMGHL